MGQGRIRIDGTPGRGQRPAGVGLPRRRGVTHGRAGRRALTVAGFVLVLAGIPSSSSAQDAAAAPPSFIGYQSVASGTALSAFPTLPALLPVPVPFEATLSLATATLSSGGQGFGRASSFFPGTLTAGRAPAHRDGGRREPAPARLPARGREPRVRAGQARRRPRAHDDRRTCSPPGPPPSPTSVRFAVPAVVGVRSLHTESTHDPHRRQDHRHQHHDPERHRRAGDGVDRLDRERGDGDLRRHPLDLRRAASPSAASRSPAPRRRSTTRACT